MALYNPIDIIAKAKGIKPDAGAVLELTKKMRDVLQQDEFTESPFVQFFQSCRVQEMDVDLKTALNINLYPLLIPEIQFCLKAGTNMNWSIFGRPGSAKSLSGLTIYEHISRLTGVPIKVRNMFTNGTFLYQRLLDLYPQPGRKKDLQKNDVLFVDENPTETTGLGSVHGMTQTKEMEIRIRKEMIHFVWVSTVLYPHQSTVVLETFDAERNTDPKLFWKVERMRLLVYDSQSILRGSIILPAPEQEVIKAYTKHIKDKGLEMYFSGTMDPKAMQLRTVADKCSTDPKFIELSNKEQRMQYIDETYGFMRLSMGQQQRILGLCKPNKTERKLAKSQSNEQPTKDGEDNEDSDSN